MKVLQGILYFETVLFGFLNLHSYIPKQTEKFGNNNKQIKADYVIS